MCDLFSNSQNTAQNTNSSQTGQSSTQGNIWNQIQPFLQQYQQQYSAGNIASTGQANPYQTEAAGNQSGVAGGQTLQPGINAASSVATNGLTPAQIQSYMSPYISSVVNPTIAAQNIQNQQGLSNLAGNQAARGALGNNTGAAAAYLAGVQPAQEATIASLENQGYNTAANTAATSAGLQLSGAGQLGNLSNVGTNANTALGSLGTSLYGVGLTPYQLENQGVTGLSGLGQIAGSNTSSSGTGTGTSNGTTTSTPSLGSILAGLAGTAIAGFEGGGAVHGDAKPDDVHAGLTPFHPHDDFATKVAKSVRHLHALKKEMGGSVGHYDDGGAVGLPPYASAPTTTPAIGNWQTTVTPAQPALPAFNAGKAGQSLSGMSDKLGSFGMNGSGSGSSDLGQQQAGLSQFLSSMNRSHFDDGGSVHDQDVYDDAMADAADAQAAARPVANAASHALPAYAPASSYAPTIPVSTPNASGWLPTYSTGVWAGQAPSAMQRVGAALTQVGDGPFAGFGKAIMEQQGMRYKDLEAQRAAQSLGMEAKQLGMQEELQPSKVSLMAAQAKGATQDANMDYQLDLARRKALLENEMTVNKAQQMNKFADTLTPDQASRTSNLLTPQMPPAEAPNAKLGQDGNWYVPNPTNPGKWRMWVPGAQGAQ